MTRRHTLLASVLILSASCSDKEADAPEDSAAGDTEPTTSSTSNGNTGTDTGTVDPEFEGMVFVEAGEFGRGCNSALSTLPCAESELPATFVMLDAFWIDETEVSTGDYEACVQDGGCTPRDAGCIAQAPAGVGQGAPDLPVVCVSHEQARAYCAWEGKRLPTEAEWEKAARGTAGAAFPWGNGGPDCLRVQASFCGDTTVPIGSLESGASPYGALEMAGNVAEWTADRFGPFFYETGPQTNPAGHEFLRDRVARGGSYLLGAEGDDLAAWRRDPRPPVGHADVGFRCARLPDPAVCGNAVVETGEVCDDGNVVSGDGCEADCEASGTVPFQGNTENPTEVLVPSGNGFVLVGWTVARTWLEVWTPPAAPEELTVITDGFLGQGAAGLPDAVALVGGRNDFGTLAVRIQSTVPDDYAGSSDGLRWEWTRDVGVARAWIVARHDGTLVVQYQTDPQSSDHIMVAVDPSATVGQEVQWEVTWDPRTVKATAADSNGRFAIASGSGVGGPGVLVEVFDYEGALQWAQTFNVDASFASFANLAFDDGGNLFVAVAQDNPAPGTLGGFALRKYDVNGVEVGTSVYTGSFAFPANVPSPTCFECSFTLAIGSDGAVYAGGGVHAPLQPIVKWSADADLVVWESLPQLNPGTITSVAVGVDGQLGWISRTAENTTELGVLHRI